jgi:tetratricopeptide (TPR) repeat protein
MASREGTPDRKCDAAYWKQANQGTGMIDQFCCHCGIRRVTHARFCTNCGKPFDDHIDSPATPEPASSPLPGQPQSSKKSYQRTACGCLLAVGILFLLLILLGIWGASGNGETTGSSRTRQQTTADALLLHERGAALYHIALREGDVDMLYAAIADLERALIAAPGNSAILVDLADAYLETRSPVLTAIAIDCYESLLDSFSNDPVLARIILGYQQLGNHTAALALAKVRLENGPANTRIPAALQASISAVLSGAPEEGLAALQADTRRRGPDISLELIQAVLEEARGDKAAALRRINALAQNHTLTPTEANFLARYRENIAHE